MVLEPISNMLRIVSSNSSSFCYSIVVESISNMLAISGTDYHCPRVSAIKAALTTSMVASWAISGRDSPTSLSLLQPRNAFLNWMRWTAVFKDFFKAIWDPFCCTLHVLSVLNIFSDKLRFHSQFVIFSIIILYPIINVFTNTSTWFSQYRKTILLIHFNKFNKYLICSAFREWHKMFSASLC